MTNNKNIILVFLLLLSFKSFSQDTGWSINHTKKGNFDISSNNHDFKFTPGGRLTFDGAYLKEDITPLASGTAITEARLSSAFKIKKLNVFVEFDFAKSKVTLKDLTARYNFTDHNFIKFGHFVEPFSANYLATTEKIAFISRPTAVSTFAPGRSVGFSYRHYQKFFWFEGGIFGDDKDQKYQGKDGYGLTGRLVLIPIEITNSHLHVGVSGSYRTADSRGLDEDGSAYYNRKLNFTTGLQNYIHTQKFMTAYIGPSGTDSYGQTDLEDLQNGGAKNQIQYDFEILDMYRKFYWQAEFIHTKVNRVLNKEKILFLEKDGSSYPETWDDISYKYGEPRPLNFYGYYIQASYLIFGGNFKYNKYSSTIRRLTNRSLQLSLAYNFTSLNDIEGNYIKGKFYTDEGVNQSVAGGTTTSYSAALNYVFNPNIRFIFEYTNQKFDNYIEDDENINIFQGRIQIVF